MASGFSGKVNIIRAGSSFLVAGIAAKPVISGMPAAVSFELTNHCNLRCPECASGSQAMNRERGFMDIRLYSDIMGQLGRYLYFTNLWHQGEPMLHPDFFSFVEAPGESYSVVSTNGHYLSVENSWRLAASPLRKLIVSLDGMDQETYSRYRINGNFVRVKQGIHNMTSAVRETGSRLKVEIQFLVNRYNEHQITQARRFAAEVRADLKLKSMQVIQPGNVLDWMPSDNRFRRYSHSGGTFALRSRLPRRCARLWFNPVVTWDGKVLPCCFDKDSEFIMGDLTRESFISIWHGSRFREFRKIILTGREHIGMCRNCTSGLYCRIIA